MPAFADLRRRAEWDKKLEGNIPWKNVLRLRTFRLHATKSSQKGIRVKKKPKRRVGVFLLKVLATLLILAVPVVVYWVYFHEGESAPEILQYPNLIAVPHGNSGRFMIDNRGNEVVSGGEDLVVPDAHFITDMNVEWEFATWDSPSANAIVGNLVENPRDIYFDVFLDETQELVYSSPIIPLGTRLQGFSLDKQLPPGEHPATLVYQLLDDDYLELDSTVSVTIVIKILE